MHALDALHHRLHHLLHFGHRVLHYHRHFIDQSLPGRCFVERNQAIDFSLPSVDMKRSRSRGRDRQHAGRVRYPERGTLHLHDLSFFVLEMVVDRFDEAVCELLYLVFHIA